MRDFLKFKNFFVLFFLSLSSVASAEVPFKHVMIVVLENTNYLNAMKQGFLSELAKNGASLSHMTALTHPSQGNYISMISGDTFGITNDNNIDLDGKHIGDLLEAQGLTWKVYAENYPGNCFLGTQNGIYVRRHIPFLSFKNISTNINRCKNIVEAKQLDADLQSNHLPNYSIYIPNLTNDGHNTGVAFADAYLSKKFGPLLKDSRFMNQMLFIVTFDESGAKNNNNQIYTVLYGDSVITGALSNKSYTHYSILKTIESAWNLGSLNKNDATANLIDDVLK